MAIINGRGTVGIRSGVSAGPQLDADATAFILAANITNSTQQSAIYTLVSSLKSAGIWTKMKAIYPFVGGTATSHKWNLKDPRDLDAAFRLTFSAGLTHSSNGINGNGVGYADTNLVPSTTLTSSKISLGVYSRTNRSGTTKIVMGSYNNINKGFLIYLRYTDNKAYFALADDSNGNTASVTKTLGFYQGSRNNSSTQSLSNINGNNYSYTYNVVGLPDTSVYIGKVNYTANFDNVEIAFSYIGEDLSPIDLSNYYTAVQTYQTSLGRQV